MSEWLRKQRARSAAKCKEAGAPVGESSRPMRIVEYLLSQSQPRDKGRKGIRRVPWLNGRPVTQPKSGHRAPGSFEKGKKR